MQRCAKFRSQPHDRVGIFSIGRSLAKIFDSRNILALKMLQGYDCWRTALIANAVQAYGYVRIFFKYALNFLTPIFVGIPRYPALGIFEGFLAANLYRHVIAEPAELVVIAAEFWTGENAPDFLPAIPDFAEKSGI